MYETLSYYAITRANKDGSNSEMWFVTHIYMFTAHTHTHTHITRANKDGSNSEMWFVIPSEYGSADAAPQPPAGSAVSLQDLPPFRVAARGFAGVH